MSSPPGRYDGGPLIRLDRVTRIHGTGRAATVALRDVDLEIARGELVALVGPSGAGKSTLLNVIGLLDTPTAGTVLFGGRDTATLTESEIDDLRSRSLGFVFQDARLIPHLDVSDNIALAFAYQRVPRRRRRADVERLVDAVGLRRRAGGRPAELSGGERQRVAIARALAGRPALILCDEPTGNLDEATSTEILDLLVGLNADGITVVIATHDPLVSSRCHRVLRITDGRLDDAGE